MKKAAIAIGVNKCGGLPVLRAASSGAAEFADWASGQRFDVHLLTDHTGDPVTGASISAVIRKWVNSRTYSLLIVYFAGHGILRNAGAEYWLLSDARDDPNEAVNVSGSILAARDAAIPHITFISDACRSRPSTSWQAAVTGRVIFPNADPRPPFPAVDEFYASRPGDPALEVEITEAAVRYKGIFTEYLLKGLKAEIDGVVEQFDNPPPPRRVVPSWTLETFLENEFPKHLSRIDLKLQQFPDIRVESHKPKYLALVNPEVSVPSVHIPPMDDHGIAGREWLNNGADGGVLHPLERPSPAPRLNRSEQQLLHHARKYHLERFFSTRKVTLAHQPSLPDREAFDREVEFIRSVQGRAVLAGHTGLSVFGQSVVRASLPMSTSLYLEQPGLKQNSAHRSQRKDVAGTAFLQFADGTGICAAVLPGFTATVVALNSRVVSISYAPSRHTPRFAAVASQQSEAQKRHAFASVAMARGLFRVAAENAEPFSKYADELKDFDPTLALFTAYAFAQAGLLENNRSANEYRPEEPIPALFDLHFLGASKRQAKESAPAQSLAPVCPMLTQGWSLLGARAESMHPALRALAGYLVPGLWTTFNSQGMERLFTELEEGVLA